jgi:hypothetical protein
MSRHRLTPLAALALLFLIAPSAALAGALVIDLRGDPFDPSAGEPLMRVEGAGAAAFSFDAAAPSAYPSDSPGSLLVRYDSTQESTRAVVPLEELYTEEDDFIFGAILTIRPEGFHADPFGFHPVTFSLINDETTGFDRTGDPTDFRADTFDTIEVAYFPQVSPLFGGPFLTPTAFGSPIGDDAFANIAFGYAPFEILPGLPHLVTLEHRAAESRLILTVHALGAGGRPVPLPGGTTEADLSWLTGFSVDTLAVTAYRDGFNIYAPSGRSLGAELEYELLFFAPGLPGEGDSLPSLMGLIRRGGEGAHGLANR